MPVRGGNGARFQRKRAADHASCLLDEVARGIHGSFTGESGRGARFGAIGRSFTGEVALGRCGEHFATALAGAGALSGRAREGFPGGSLRRQRGQGVGGPILAFAERRGCGQDSVPPDGPAAGGGIARALGPTTGGGIARAPSVFQRHLPHSGQVSGLFPIGYLCKTTRD